MGQVGSDGCLSVTTVAVLLFVFAMFTMKALTGSFSRPTSASADSFMCWTGDWGLPTTMVSVDAVHAERTLTSLSQKLSDGSMQQRNLTLRSNPFRRAVSLLGSHISSILIDRCSMTRETVDQRRTVSGT
jgi:hypothetical protein